MNYPRRALDYGALTLPRNVLIAVAASAVFGLRVLPALTSGVEDRVSANKQGAAAYASGLPSSLSPTELGLYSHARTLMDWTPKELKECDFLGKLRIAAKEDELPSILKQVGERAAATISEFRNVACDERVYSEWNVGSPIATWREMGPNEVAHHFLYVILSRPVGDPRMFTEYRTDPKGRPVDLTSLPDLPLITANFTGSWAYFNSSNQIESNFRYLGEDVVSKQLRYVVGFAQKPEMARNVTTFEFGKQSAAILVEGIAWVDERTFQITRIETWLLAPRNDIGLESQTTTVNYRPVFLAGLKDSLWLPGEVTVVVHYKNLFIRNTHRYSRFKLFAVHVVTNPVRREKAQRQGSRGGTCSGRCR